MPAKVQIFPKHSQPYTMANGAVITIACDDEGWAEVPLEVAQSYAKSGWKATFDGEEGASAGEEGGHVEGNAEAAFNQVALAMGGKTLAPPEPPAPPAVAPRRGFKKPAAE